MALPETRDFDAVDTGPLPHTTVNAMQDAIVGGKHGLITRSVNVAQGKPTGGPLYADQSGWFYQGGLERVAVGIDGLIEGQIITEIKVYIFQNGANPMTARLYKRNSTGTQTSLWFDVGNATVGAKSYTMTANHVVEPATAYDIFVFSASQNLDTWYHATVKVKNP